MHMASAADHLANERTFLAYIRTSLAFVGFGFVIARFAVYLRQFAIIQHQPAAGSGLSVVFGMTMVLAGVVVAAFGAYRYASQMRALSEGRPDPLSRSAAVGTAAVIAIFGVLMAYILFRV